MWAFVVNVPEKGTYDFESKLKEWERKKCVGERRLYVPARGSNIMMKGMKGVLACVFIYSSVIVADAVNWYSNTIVLMAIVKDRSRVCHFEKFSNSLVTENYKQQKIVCHIFAWSIRDELNIKWTLYLNKCDKSKRLLLWC